MKYRITEESLQRMVREAVEDTLNEGFFNGMANNLKQAATTTGQNQQSQGLRSAADSIKNKFQAQGQNAGQISNQKVGGQAMQNNGNLLNQLKTVQQTLNQIIAQLSQQ